MFSKLVELAWMKKRWQKVSRQIDWWKVSGLIVRDTLLKKVFKLFLVSKCNLTIIQLDINIFLQKQEFPIQFSEVIKTDMRVGSDSLNILSFSQIFI